MQPAEKARDEALPLVDPDDPAQAWIARYEAEANRAKPVPTRSAAGRHVRPQRDTACGTSAATSGNGPTAASSAWTLDPNGTARVTNTNCGVRVVQGAHRTYMTDFIRDPRTGGCAAGVPPANLGFRLVVEDRWPVTAGIVENFVSLLRRT